jgi:deoxyadenosine/deoxycytidine kinase
MAPTVICIDGNIGAGKTSVLNELERRGHYVFKEELSTWGWCLDEYYSNPIRWSFTLQMAILHSMATQYQKMTTLAAERVVFVERSPESGMIFSRNSFRHGTLSRQELNLIGNFYDMFGWTPHVTFKLDTDPAKCLERVGRRARECEKDLTIEYICALDEEYRALAAIELDGSLSANELADKVEKFILNI